MKLGAEASRRGDEAYARGDMREAERQYARERKIVETHNRYQDNINNTKSGQKLMEKRAEQRRNGQPVTSGNSRQYSRSTYMGLNGG